MKELAKHGLSLTQNLVAGSCLALLLSMAVGFFLVVAYDLKTYRERRAEKLSMEVQPLLYALPTAINWDDRDSAMEMLKLYRYLDTAVAMHAYTSTGELFAGWGELSDWASDPASLSKVEKRWRGNVARYAYPIAFGGESKGVLLIEENLPPLVQRIPAYNLFFILLGMTLFFLFALGVVLVRRLIIRPVLELQEVVEAIASRGDYSRRAKVTSSDEIGWLARSINEMAAALRSRSRELTSQRERYRQFIETSSDAVASLAVSPPVDTDLPEQEQVDLICDRLRFESINSKGMELLGAPSRGALEGVKLSDMIGQSHWTSRENLSATLLEFVRNDYRLLTDDIEYTRNDGRVFWLRRVLVGIRSGGKLERVWHVFSDVTAIQRANAKLREAVETETRLRLHAQEMQEEAQRASEAKSQFLAVMSHELRTPLNPIIGFTTLLLKEDLPPDTRKPLETILQSSQHLLGVIGNVLDFSKIESERLELIKEPTDLREEVTAVFESFQQKMEAKGLRGELDMDEQLPSRPILDGGMLRQVLMNLLSNAIKFTDKGIIQLRVERRLAQGQPWLRFEVGDSGIGIRPEAQKQLFEPFYQVDLSLTREYEGSGLGLAICKRLVEAGGGSIGLDSEEGRGSTFWFNLPLKEVEEDGEKAAPPAAAGMTPDGPPRRSKPWRVLFAEDNLSNRAVGTKELERMGLSVTEASDGKEALELARQQRFDLFLLDVQMPKLDGISLVKQLKETDRYRKAPMVAYTAFANPEVVEKIREAGFDEIVVKPVSERSLRNVINRALYLAADRAG